MRDYTTEKIDWELYIERQQPLYMMAVVNITYVKLLEEATGFGLNHQVCWFKDGSGTYYNSGAEMRAADEYYLELIERGDERLEQWSARGLELNQVADRLIEQFSQPVATGEIISGFEQLQSQTEQIILYSTIIPYRMLSAVNYAIDHRGAREKDYESAMKLFEPLRAETKYPQLGETVYRSFWRAAAEKLGKHDEHFYSLMTPSELRTMFGHGSTNGLDRVSERSSGCTFWLDGDELLFHYGDDYLDRIGVQRFDTRDVQEIEGSVANSGTVVGTVRVINTLDDATKFSDGDIIVSINTRTHLKNTDGVK